MVPVSQLACAAGRLTLFTSSATSGSEEKVVEQRRPQVRLPTDGGYRDTETKQRESDAGYYGSSHSAFDLLLSVA